uniref:Fimbrin 2 n=1 Tax=Halisarca dujardinii TaxID=2583056 RepID=A0A9F1U4P7_HALDU|nr:fimbrin 2 [Halisarca dujardinii]
MSAMSEERKAEIRAQFDQFDEDKNGHITAKEIGNVMKGLGESVPQYKIRDMIKEVDLDENGTVEFEEFVIMFQKIQGGKKKFALADTSEKAKKLVKVEGTVEGVQHSFSEEETAAFADWINFQLEEDPEAQKYLPISEEGLDLFKKVGDGIVLCKLINTSVPNTIDERTINKEKLSVYRVHENHTLALNSASAIGCNIVNIGADDLVQGRPHLALGLLWQVIRIGLFAKINLQNCPELYVLLKEGETLADLLALSPEEILLRWFNYHLESAGHPRRVANFSKDIMDSENYTVLLSQIAPEGSGVDRSPLQEHDVEKRAVAMLGQADKIKCKKFVRAKDVVKGNSRLNMAFVANLFNNYPALKAPEEGLPDFDLGDFGETREERTFRNWMNSLGVNPFVNNLYSDLCDGLVLLQLLDKVKPGIVDWGKVNDGDSLKKMGGNMKKLENCNYAVELAHKLRFSLVGIGGRDINDGNRTLTLAVVWQLMRAYTLAVLQKLSDSDKPVTDADIVAWANDMYLSAKKDSKVASFRDPSIATSLPVIDLVDAIRAGAVNYDIVHAEATSEEDLMANAKYAISMSRKIGARVYALPEDLVEVKQKMVMTVYACLMTKAQGKK